MIEAVSKLFAKEDKIEKLISMFKEMIEPTKKEKGYILYEMYQDKDNPSVLIVLEQWETKEDFDAHCSSEHFYRIVPQMLACMEKESEVNICHRVA
ncbi:putative quinol monooxygenase [Marinifilum flexuosum]|uniref:putative quinol monooxygenase n=1 Tax=Marinifilum flexuosum TaxID=1117708 RepID=UPI0024926079|nr:putative quinol monooxygenase [Marinifilum flexuosum]